MKRRIILSCIVGLFFLLANKTEVFAWSCCKSTASTGGCGSCTVSGGRDPVTLAQRCGEGAPWCQTATPNCGNGWSSSCSSGNCDSCTLTCTDCSNSTTCYKPKAVTCNTTCPSGKYHKTECPTGWAESNCSAISQPTGCTDTYNCCTCTKPNIICSSVNECNDYSSCTTDTCKNPGTTSSYCSNVSNGTCNITPTPYNPPDPECIWPYCLDSGYTLAANCSEDCESANHWLNEVYYVCVPSRAYPAYICRNNVDYRYYYYSWEACPYCGADCTCSDSGGWCIQPLAGADGTCNSYTTSRSQTNVPDSSSLCYSGYPTTPILSGYNWIWDCLGVDGQCGGAKGSDIGCSAVANSPPIFNGLIVKNNNSNVVPAETGNKNQICGTVFNSSRSITFNVSASDPDGDADIKNVTLTWNGNTITRKSAVGATTTFGTTFPSTNNNSSIYPFIVTITDSAGGTAVDTSRSFKIWDCKVPVSGTVYDATDDGSPSCPNVGFTKQADRDVLNFTSLVFKGGGIGVSMTIGSIGTSYTSGTNNLTWGVNGYVPEFNGNISLTNDRAMKSKSSSAASPKCDWYIDTIDVDPYSTTPSFTADFSGILIQDPWWQASEGGVISNNKVTGQIPITCATNCKISLNGLVAAPTINNDTSKSLENSQSWYYSATNAKLANINTNYSYFYDQYFIKKGVGTTLVGDKTLTSIDDLGSDTNNIYFINGNLTITGDIVNTNNFLMIIVNGDITVSSGVNRVDGILVANNINATGSSDNQLVFKGSLYASNNVDFSRDYIDKLTNNLTPSVVVNYDPKLIFNIPGELTKVLTRWQWGN